MGNSFQGKRAQSKRDYKIINDWIANCKSKDLVVLLMCPAYADKHGLILNYGEGLDYSTYLFCEGLVTVPETGDASLLFDCGVMGEISSLIPFKNGHVIHAGEGFIKLKLE